jgi:hypothetical protein
LHVTSVDTSVTPPLPFFPSRYGAGCLATTWKAQRSVFQEIRLRRRNRIKKINANVMDVVVVQDRKPSSVMEHGHSPVISLTSGRKTRCYQRAVNFSFFTKKCFWSLFRRTNEKDPPTGHALAPSASN